MYTRLSDGSAIVTRPIAPTDKQMLSEGRVDLERPADIGMTDLAGRADFGRQAASESGRGALQRDTTLQLFIEGLENNPHPAAPLPAHDEETSTQNVPGL